MCGLHIQSSGKMTFPMIFGVLFKSALRLASGTRFFPIFGDFEVPGTPFWRPETPFLEAKKMMKKTRKTGSAVEPGPGAVGP